MRGPNQGELTLEAIKGEKTVAQLSSQYEVHASQINNWKRQAQARMAESSEHGSDRPSAKEIEAKEDRLYRQIGKLQVEVDWLRKKSRALCQLPCTQKISLADK